MILIGQAGIGKTVLCIRLIEQIFRPDYDLTIGTDFFTHKISIPDHDVYLQIWDFAGQVQFHPMLDIFVKGTDGVLLAFDLTNLESFLALETIWLPFLQEHVLTAPVFLIGIKQDLEAHREVDESQIMASKDNLPHWVCYLPALERLGNPLKIS